MAIAGRSYANVPIISRGSLVDPPVLTTPDPVVVAFPNDRRWYNTSRPVVVSNPAAPALTFTTTPAPVVVASQFTQPKTVQAFVTRNTLQDPPVLTTPSPTVVAALLDKRWLAVRPPTISSNPQPAAPVAFATPQPVIITSPTDRRWFNVYPAQVIDNVPLGTIPVFTATPKPIIVTSNRPAQFLFRQAQIVRNPPPPVISPVRHPLNLSGTLTDENKLSGTVTEVIYNGTVTVVTIGGTLTRVTTVVNGTVVGWTMQEVDITLAEFNDETLDLTLLTSGGGALNITGMELDMFLKSAAGTPDGSATKLSTITGEIVITNPTGGLATVAIPASDLGSGNGYGFYRVDTVNGGFRNTAIFGKVSVTPL